MNSIPPTPNKIEAQKKPNPLEFLLTPLSKGLSFVFLGIAKIVIRFLEIVFDVLWKINNRFVKFSEGFRMRLGKKFSKKHKNAVGMMVVYAGLTRNPEEILGIVLIYSIMVSFLCGFVTYVYLNGKMFMGFSFLLVVALSMVASFILLWVLFYMVFIVLIDRRTSSIERVLPDVLTIISQNMIAGMTLYNSLWTAARPEFGPLALELQSVAKETLGGESFEKSLTAMSNRIKSYKLSRSVKLMIQGMKSGGELPAVLQEIASDIRTEQALYKKMSSQTTSQVLFIVFALLVGAPLLFAASMQFVGIFNNIYEKIGFDNSKTAAPMQNGMIKLSKLPIGEDFFFNYAIITLAVMGILGSLIIGVIKTGKVSSGIPIIPILPTLSILIFYGLVTVLSSFFRGMIGT